MSSEAKRKSFKINASWKFYPQLKFTFTFPQLIEKKGPVQFLPATKIDFHEQKAKTRRGSESRLCRDEGFYPTRTFLQLGIAGHAPRLEESHRL